MRTKTTTKITVQPVRKWSTVARIRKVFRDSGNDIIKDIKESETMPYDTGQLQNSLQVDESLLKAETAINITSETPYAKRLYFHPDYKFRRDKNRNAAGGWFEPYIRGDKRHLLKKIVVEKMKKRGL